jgi:hypothetical protein
MLKKYLKKLFDVLGNFMNKNKKEVVNSIHKCDIEGCEREVFNDEKQCVFHSNKESWITINDPEEDESNVNYFWNEFKKLVNSRDYEERELYNLFNDFEFPKLEQHIFNDFTFKNSLVFNETCTFYGNLTFLNTTFIGEVYFHDNLIFKNSLKIIKCSIKDKFTFNGIKNMKEVDFYNTIFEEKVEIKESEFIEDVSFRDTKFKKTVDFYKTKFKRIVNFEKTDFDGVSVFTQTKFYKQIDFKYTTFNKRAIFRSTRFKEKLNLKDSIFNADTNFLDIKVNKLNRETARIIKDSFEQQNNIIEANKFYALEMKSRKKELSWTKDFFEKFVFSFHGWSSNHSQDWLLALFWILNISFVSSMFISFINEDSSFVRCLDITLSMAILLIIIGSILFKVKEFLGNWSYFIITSFVYGMYVNILDTYSLDSISNNINPFSVMNSWDDITFSELIYKIIIGYLIYQFIVSIRQNTRRK